MYVISYDIGSDRLRNKIAKVLLNYGKRVQYSVFECRISQKSFEELYRKLALLMAEADEGSVRFYHLCGKCDQEIRELGLGAINPPSMLSMQSRRGYSLTSIHGR